MRRARRQRGRTPKGSGAGWIATVFEGLVDGLLDFLFSWGRK
ncbi:hypothetical protein [Streptomyces sp. NPDC016172]|jgi:hypothetical protein